MNKAYREIFSQVIVLLCVLDYILSLSAVFTCNDKLSKFWLILFYLSGGVTVIMFVGDIIVMLVCLIGMNI